MKIHTLRALKDNFMYVLENGDGRAAVVDPGEAAPVKAFLASHNLKLTHVLCTHHHNDHIGGALELNAPHIVASAYDASRIPGCNLKVSESTGPLDLWGSPVQILDMPGHTLGQIAYLIGDALFTGDTLFSAGCGRLFEGTPAQMFASLAKIKRLPKTTKIYFGHEYTINNLKFVEAREPRPEVAAYLKRAEVTRAADHDTTPSTLALELEVNPFLRAHSVGEFAEWREARNSW